MVALDATLFISLPDLVEISAVMRFNKARYYDKKIINIEVVFGQITSALCKKASKNNLFYKNLFHFNILLNHFIFQNPDTYHLY